MPAKFDVVMTRDAMYKCLPEEIEIRSDLNGRQDKPDIEWLLADILKHGQMEPVLIWNDGGAAVLAAGFSRWRAISEINRRKLTPVPLQIKCVYIKCNEQGAFIRNISENRMRNPTSAVDDAHNIQRLLAWGMPESEVASVYFPTAATESELKTAIKWIHGRVELIKLTPEAEQAVRDGRLGETAAQAISKLSSAQQRKVLEKDGEVKVRDIKPPKVKPLKIDVELRRRITAVVESADFESYDEAKGVWIDVNAEALCALKNYIE